MMIEFSEGAGCERSVCQHGRCCASNRLAERVEKRFLSHHGWRKGSQWLDVERLQYGIPLRKIMKSPCMCLRQTETQRMQTWAWTKQNKELHTIDYPGTEVTVVSPRKERRATQHVKCDWFKVRSVPHSGSRLRFCLTVSFLPFMYLRLGIRFCLNT